jgi:hypothetical protein
MKQSAEAAQREQADFELRQKTMNAQLIMQQAAYHHALQMYPAEEKAANLDVLNKATASYKDALAEGYDIADPAQAALWRQMQQNIINIPFSSGQKQQEVLQSATDAAEKNGKNITDFVPLVDYNDGKHGTGGNLTLVPTEGLQQVQATPRQINMGMAQMRATLQTATTALGKDDPDVKALSGKVDMIQKVLDGGGKPSAYDFIALNSSVIGPLSTRIAGASQTAKIQKEKDEELKAQQDTDPVYQAKLAGMKAAEEAKVRQPYEVALKKMEAPIAEGTANNLESAKKITASAGEYVNKVQSVNELLSSLDQAEQGNSAASKAALIKLTGIAMPPGSKRLSPEALNDLRKQGNVPEQFIGKIKNALTGDEWTSQMSQDMRDFAKGQADVAAEKLRADVRISNVTHHTNVDPEELLKAAGAPMSGTSSAAGKGGSLADKWKSVLKTAEKRTTGAP